MRFGTEVLTRRRQFADGDLVIGCDSGPGSFRTRTGTVEKHEGPGEYWVRFDDGRLECVLSSWLELNRTSPNREPGNNGATDNLYPQI